MVVYFCVPLMLNKTYSILKGRLSKLQACAEIQIQQKIQENAFIHVFELVEGFSY